MKKSQEDIKRQADKSRKESKDQKVRDKVFLNMKNLVFKKRPVKKVVEHYIGPYEIEKVVSTNAVKLRLPTSIRIYLVVNISQIMQYKEQVKGQRKEEEKPVKVEAIKEQKVKINSE